MTESTTASRSVIIEREFQHSPEKVWRALTQGALIEQWLMKNDFEPVVGRRFNLRMTSAGDWSGVIDCEVLAVVPYECLSYSWKAADAEAATGIKLGTTVVTWTLTPTKDGVRVRMEQSGFPPQAEFNKYFQGANYGWQKFVGDLELMLAKLD